MKGTDVKDDAARHPPTFYTPAPRPCVLPRPSLASGLACHNSNTGGEEPGAVVCGTTLETRGPRLLIRRASYAVDRRFRKALRLATHQPNALPSASIRWPFGHDGLIAYKSPVHPSRVRATSSSTYSSFIPSYPSISMTSSEKQPVIEYHLCFKRSSHLWHPHRTGCTRIYQLWS